VLVAERSEALEDERCDNGFFDPQRKGSKTRKIASLYTSTELGGTDSRGPNPAKW
jgi:hypothetical protein